MKYIYSNFLLTILECATACNAYALLQHKQKQTKKIDRYDNLNQHKQRKTSRVICRHTFFCASSLLQGRSTPDHYDTRQMRIHSLNRYCARGMKNFRIVNQRVCATLRPQHLCRWATSTYIYKLNNHKKRPH